MLIRKDKCLAMRSCRIWRNRLIRYLTYGFRVCRVGASTFVSVLAIRGGRVEVGLNVRYSLDCILRWRATAPSTRPRTPVLQVQWTGRKRGECGPIKQPLAIRVERDLIRGPVETVFVEALVRAEGQRDDVEGTRSSGRWIRGMVVDKVDWCCIRRGWHIVV